MLDIRLFRADPELVRRGLASRGADTSVVDKIRETDTEWRSGLGRLEALRARRNAGSKAIATTSDPAARREGIDAMRALGQQIKALEAQVAAAEAEVHALLMALPNLPDPEVPAGDSDADNVVVRSVGTPAPAAEAKAHWDLGTGLGIIDFERGARLAGSRFYVLRGAGARLQRALIDWMLELQTSRGYLEIYPPFVVREQCMRNSGQLPKFADNLYRDIEDDLWLVPTAEVPLTNLHAGEILEDEDLPVAYVAHTACFRREKMSAGRDVRGIKRGHQFDKVELYRFTRPEDSEAALENMVDDATAVLEGLELPYRVAAVCTGDLGFAARKTYDVEVWAPGVREWLEVSSVSNVGDFQARRASIRFRRRRGGPPEPVHTLNASGLALPRTMIAVMESYQLPDGRIRVPDVLQKRMGTDVIG